MRRTTTLEMIFSMLFAAAPIVACNQTVDTGDDVDGGATVEVTYGGSSTTVSLGSLPTSQLVGADVVTLDAIVGAAELPITLADVWLNFIADDGFEPSEGAYCPDDIVPVDGERAAQGGLELGTRNLLWDDALGYPGCLHVDGVATIEVLDTATTDTDTDTDTDSDTDTDTEADAGTEVDTDTTPCFVDVTYGADTATVALTGLATAVFEGVTVVTLDAIIAEAGVSVDLSGTTLHFAASDGYDPDDQDTCEAVTPVPGSVAAQGGIEHGTRNLMWDEALGYPGCLHVDDTATIVVADN